MYVNPNFTTNKDPTTTQVYSSSLSMSLQLKIQLVAADTTCNASYIWVE